MGSYRPMYEQLIARARQIRDKYTAPAPCTSGTYLDDMRFALASGEKDDIGTVYLKIARSRLFGYEFSAEEQRLWDTITRLYVAGNT